jgi:hypothetical protein
MKQSVVDRAWGFAPEEYIDAFSRVYSREVAEAEVSEIFGDLENDPSHSVGGEDFLFALLSLVSPDCRMRILAITHWSDEELRRQQVEALKGPP